MDHNISDARAATITLATVIIGVCAIKKRKAVERRYWERPHLGVKKRLIHGHQNSLNQKRMSDVDSFASIICLRPESFDKLLSIVGPMIPHYSNREPINAPTRLAVTLRYLASGESKKSLGYNYRLGETTVTNIIWETLGAVYNSLQPIVLPELTTEKWLQIADGFNRRWNKPAHSGSEFHNYKGFFSTVMMAICDSEYKFVAADVGCQGRNNDVIVLNDSKIGDKLMNGTFNLPGEKEIKYGPVLPHFLLADGIFGLKSYLMVPFPGRGIGTLNYAQQIYNYRQARGRRVIENTFGIFANVWRIFRTEINATPNTVDRIVMAAVCLHNFRIIGKETNVEFYESDSTHGSKISQFKLESVNEPLFCISESDYQADYIRDELSQYFINAGRVYWQDKMILK